MKTIARLIFCCICAVVAFACFDYVIFGEINAFGERVPNTGIWQVYSEGGPVGFVLFILFLLLMALVILFEK